MSQCKIITKDPECLYATPGKPEHTTDIFAS